MISNGKVVSNWLGYLGKVSCFRSIQYHLFVCLSVSPNFSHMVELIGLKVCVAIKNHPGKVLRKKVLIFFLEWTPFQPCDFRSFFSDNGQSVLALLIFPTMSANDHAILFSYIPAHVFPTIPHKSQLALMTTTHKMGSSLHHTIQILNVLALLIFPTMSANDHGILFSYIPAHVFQTIPHKSQLALMTTTHRMGSSLHHTIQILNEHITTDEHITTTILNTSPLPLNTSPLPY